MIAIKYSDGSFYPIWWIEFIITDVDQAPPGYQLMSQEDYTDYLIDTELARENFLNENVAIPNAKIEKYNYIDTNTGLLINNGFTFAGLTFSLSQNAQINWSNILQLPEEAFPINVMSVNEDIYSLSLANRMNFYLSAVNGKNIPLQSGSLLKAEIKAMNNLQEIENFVDPRI